MIKNLLDYDLMKVSYISGYKLKLDFKDGESGEIDFQNYFDKVKAYDSLKDIRIFKNFSIESGILCWKKGEIDIAPETLYHDATGIPYPDWLDA